MKEGDSVGNSRPAPGESSGIDASKLSSSSPLSAQDLNSVVSQDMPISSTDYHSWAGEMSALQPTRISSDNSLDRWTHFDANSSLHQTDSEGILKELLKTDGADHDTSDSSAFLKSLLNDNDKSGEDSNKRLKQMLGDTSSMQNGSPTHGFANFAPTHQQENGPNNGSSNPFMQGLSDFPGGSLKRKVDDVDGADGGSPPKLADKNKMLAALLQNTPKTQPELSAAVLPIPNPGDLPQNKLPKDLNNRMIPPVGNRNQPRNVPFGSNGANTQMTEISMDQSLYGTQTFISTEFDDSLLELVEDLQELAHHDSMSISQSSMLQPTDRQAIDSIRKSLMEDVPDMLPDSSFRDNMLPMGPRFPGAGLSINQIRPNPMQGILPGDNSLRMPMMMPGPGQPRPGMPPDFGNSRSPLPSAAIRSQIRAQSWNRQQTRQQAMVPNQGAPIPIPNGPPNGAMQRSISIPNNPQFPMNGFQNMPQPGQQFSNQTSMPYSLPPQQPVRFVSTAQSQPLSPRGPQPNRMGMRPTVWPMQQQPGQQMGQMGMVAQGMMPGHGQQTGNFPNQQFMNQNGQQFSPHPQSMMQGGPAMPQRFPGNGGAQLGQFNQGQGMVQQQDQFMTSGGNFYARNMAPGMQQRMGNPQQNVPMMRNSFPGSVGDDMRPSDGNFGSFPMNGNMQGMNPNSNGQPGMRWDMSGGQDRPGMQNNGNMNAGNGGRMSNPSVESSFDQFDSIFAMDQPNGNMNGMSFGNPQNNGQPLQNMGEQQFMRSFNDQSGTMGQQMQHQMSQHPGQQFPPDLSQMNHPGNSPGHHMPLDRQKSTQSSLLQQLLSESTS